MDLFNTRLAEQNAHSRAERGRCEHHRKYHEHHQQAEAQRESPRSAASWAPGRHTWRARDERSPPKAESPEHPIRRLLLKTWLSRGDMHSVQQCLGVERRQIFAFGAKELTQLAGELRFIEREIVGECLIIAGRPDITGVWILVLAHGLRSSKARRKEVLHLTTQAVIHISHRSSDWPQISRMEQAVMCLGNEHICLRASTLPYHTLTRRAKQMSAPQNVLGRAHPTGSLARNGRYVPLCRSDDARPLRPHEVNCGHARPVRRARRLSQRAPRGCRQCTSLSRPLWP